MRFDFNLHYDGESSHAKVIAAMGCNCGLTTYDAYALSRIDRKLGYSPEDELVTEIRAISLFSSTLHGLGVHVELHLSPGHARIPGNVATDGMAKKTQRKLFLQTTKSGLTMA
ncbi:unnamed protein product [Penicillium camemberti]|uniref:Str. FM013 n=1 Tax=Penicillium camemberti (strain FM 013) TaxID=1429867 RepID=A0A0G4PNQ9_PENC3|nr:unnamed protein product [Penicillium camemberti]